MSYPQQQPPPYQPQPPMGMLHLTIQGSVMTSSMIPPTVHLNGYPVKVRYGENAIPVYAGPLHIDVYCQWMRKFGRAALDCTVQPNQAVPVFYASPYHQFANDGSIGHTPMKRNGLAFVLILPGVIVGLSILVVLLAILLS